MTTKENNQAWSKAKEVFESMIHLEKAEMFNQLNGITALEASIKNKVKKLIDSMDKNKTLFSQTSSKLAFQNIERLMDWSGKSINDYLIKELIAVGGMSSIYRAKRLSSEVQKPVAIKVMQPYRDNASIVALFKQEQQALSKLDHPNIVSFFHGDQTKEGVYYLVMEYIAEARTLDKYVKENQCDIKTIVSLIKQVADAMTYAHSHLIIHKDLKSPNILVDQHGAIKVIDFGIAALEEETHTVYPKIYTPTIASPEQIKGEKVTAGTDVFSLSATLLDLLIEDSPLPKFDPETYQEIDDEKYVDKVLSSANIDKDLKKIIAKGLQTQLKDRYASMDALANDLGAWLEHKPISLLNHKLSHRLVKHFKRNPVSSWSLSLLALAVITATILITHYAFSAKKEAENSAVTLRFLTEVLSQSDPSKGNASDITIKKALEKTLSKQKSILANNPETKLNIMTHLVEIYTAQSMFNEASEIAKEIHALVLASDGPEALSTLQWQATLAKLLKSAGKYSQAIETSQALINRLDRNQPDQANIILSAMINIAHIYMTGTQDHPTRRKHMQSIMTFIDKNGVTDHDLISRAWFLMAIVDEGTGDIQLFNTRYQKALFHQEKSTGKLHPDYASSLNSYAVSLTKMGQYELAEPVFIESIELARQYDDKGLVYGRNLLQYATKLFRTEHREKALHVLHQSLTVIEGSDHLFTQMIGHETSYRFKKQMMDFPSSLTAAIRSMQKAQILYQPDDYPFIKNTLSLAENLVILEQYELSVKVLELLLQEPTKIEPQYQDKTKFHLGLIAWLTGDLELIKRHQILNPNSINLNNQTWLLELLEKYPVNTKNKANLLTTMTNEHTLLSDLLTPTNTAPNMNKCEIPKTMKSKTDLIVLKVILTLCDGAPDMPQTDILKAISTAHLIEPEKSQIELINHIFNH